MEDISSKIQNQWKTACQSIDWRAQDTLAGHLTAASVVVVVSHVCSSASVVVVSQADVVEGLVPGQFFTRLGSRLGNISPGGQAPQ